MDHHAFNAARHTGAWHVQVLGLQIGIYSRDIVQRLAMRGGLSSVNITSVRREVRDQARIFFLKHVIEQKRANYKNREVSEIVAHARSLRSKGSSDRDVQAYLMRAIEHVHGGPASVSRHLLGSPFVEIFDVAHYSGPTAGRGRHNYMSDDQAKLFLDGCRELVPLPISRLGHSAELGIGLHHYEFVDEKCFHLEVLQPFDGLEMDAATKFA